MPRWKVPRAAGIQDRMEEARTHFIQNIDRYMRASDFLRPRGRELLKRMQNYQLPPSLFAWLWKYRGWPEELIPYPVNLNEEWPRVVWEAMAEWSSLRRMADALRVATGLVVDREEIIRWLYGKEPDELAKEWLREQAARRTE